MTIPFLNFIPTLRVGTLRADTINGASRNDLVFALNGDDIISTGAGNDTIFAGNGNDRIEGGTGSDIIDGGSGTDTAIYAGSIDDYVIDMSGRSRGTITIDAIGGTGKDRLSSIETLYFEGDNLTVFVDGRNNAAIARDDVAATDEDTALTIDAATLLANDKDFDGDTLTVTGVSGTSASGAPVSLVDGVVTYDPGAIFQDLDAGETATDTFTYTVGDGRGGVSEATVTVTIAGLDDTPAPAAAPRINEIHYDNAGTDTGEFVEIRVAKDADVSSLRIDLYNGSGGATYGNVAVASLTKSSDDAFDYYVWDLPANGIQNGSPDGIALSDASGVIEFLSYEGTMTATNGPAAGQTSTDIGVSEMGSEPVGQSLQRIGDGPTDWTGPAGSTRGSANEGGGTDPGEPTELLISEVQGSGTASPVVGDYVLVSAVVTYTIGNGFFLQEETADDDGNALTSEGIFVFTGGAPSVAVGDQIEVAGTVQEFNGSTQIGGTISIDKLNSSVALPAYAAITLPLASAEALERFEGMRVSLTSGTADAITVTENFDLARFGEIAVSAGNKVQPTQVFDPQTQATEIAELQEANALNRLLIDDGSTRQNPTEFEYLPAVIGDDGDGYLDAGDNFTTNGPTIRLGSELNAPASGVLHYDFGDYRMLIDGRISIDETTNSGARTDAPDAVGGRLTVSSFNLLNFFTTLDDGQSGGSGPENLDPRGATSAADYQRQLDKIVEAMTAIDADVFGLQELENKGFGDASAIKALIDAVNARLGSDVYAFVDPTEDGGFVGTDAITTGLIYRKSAVTLEQTGVFEFSTLDGQQQSRPAIAATFTEAETGERFSVVVNHFKSKGGTGTGDNADSGDGQGSFNGIRTDHAAELSAWLRDVYLPSAGDTDALLIGDLNSYAKEDPLSVLRDGGFIDLLDSFIGQDRAYSYVFDGQRGTLDHGLASGSLAGRVTGITEWHINADEPTLLAYSSQFNDPRFYNEDPYAASDHDPLIIGLNLGSEQMAIA